MSLQLPSAFVASALHCVVWLVGSSGTQAVLAHSSARVGYGLLSAWWATLYFDAWARARWATIPILCVLVGLLQLVSINILTVSIEPLPLSASGLTVLLLRCLAFTSPIIVNGVIRFTMHRWRLVDRPTSGRF